MRKLSTLVLVALGSALCAGCGGAGISIIRTDLAPGALSRADNLVVKPVAADQTEFLGDFSDDPPSVAANRESIKNTYHAKLVTALVAAGFKAEALAEGAQPPEGAVVVDMVAEKFDAGSNAARVVWGFGAGASFLLTAVKVTKGGAVLADVTVDATSGGRGGFSAIGNWLDMHLDDSVEQLVEYLSERLPQ